MPGLEPALVQNVVAKLVVSITSSITNISHKHFQRFQKVRYKSVWGTICDDNFGEAEAIVACRQL